MLEMKCSKTTSCEYFRKKELTPGVLLITCSATSELSILLGINGSNADVVGKVDGFQLSKVPAIDI